MAEFKIEEGNFYADDINIKKHTTIFNPKAYNALLNKQKLVNDDFGRPILNGAYFDDKNEVVVSTDSHKIVVRSYFPKDETYKYFNGNIVMSGIKKCSKNGLTYDEKLAGGRFDGKYVNWQAVFPTEYNYKVSFSRDFALKLLSYCNNSKDYIKDTKIGKVSFGGVTLKAEYVKQIIVLLLNETSCDNVSFYFEKENYDGVTFFSDSIKGLVMSINEENPKFASTTLDTLNESFSEVEKETPSKFVKFKYEDNNDKKGGEEIEIKLANKVFTKRYGKEKTTEFIFDKIVKIKEKSAEYKCISETDDFVAVSNSRFAFVDYSKQIKVNSDDYGKADFYRIIPNDLIKEEKDWHILNIKEFVGKYAEYYEEAYKEDVRFFLDRFRKEDDLEEILKKHNIPLTFNKIVEFISAEKNTYSFPKVPKPFINIYETNRDLGSLLFETLDGNKLKFNYRYVKILFELFDLLGYDTLKYKLSADKNLLLFSSLDNKAIGILLTYALYDFDAHVYNVKVDLSNDNTKIHIGNNDKKEHFNQAIELLSRKKIPVLYANNIKTEELLKKEGHNTMAINFSLSDNADDSESEELYESLYADNYEQTTLPFDLDKKRKDFEDTTKELICFMNKMAEKYGKRCSKWNDEENERFWELNKKLSDINKI